MEQDEDLTHHLVTTYFDVLAETVQRYGGSVAEKRGDALLAEFAQPSDALGAALTFQRDIEARNHEIEGSIRPYFRIGINLGEVIADRGTVWGPGVNLSQRVEQLAEPGGVAVTDTVFNAISKTLPVTYEDLGEQRSKDTVVHAYAASLPQDKQILPSGDTSRSNPNRSFSGGWSGKPSIAVLSFDNLSADSDQDYFADGIAEEIITALSRIREIDVIARHSSFAYKGQAVDVKEVAAALGVGYVMEGSVRKAGDRIRITAQLIDALSDRHLWAEHYDRTLADALAVQDEITERVVGAIQPELYRAELHNAQNKPIESSDAWGYTVRARGQMTRMDKEMNAQAETYLKMALEKDPEYVPALAFLTYCHFLDVMFGWSSNPGESIGEAMKLGRIAGELDNQDPWVCCILGLSEFISKQPDKAIRHFEKAVELSPSFAVAYGYLALQRAYTGEPDAAITAAERAIWLSPTDPELIHFYCAIAVAHFVAKRYQEAIDWAQKGVTERSSHVGAQRILVASYAMLEQASQTSQALNDLLTVAPGISITSVMNAIHFKNPDDSEHYVTGLRKAGIPED
jgi:TolB-like protein/Tfp pilus assembly protein PilF